MDTLALLCNLYGDGPQTLRRLREAGCATLASLETLDSERLASLLRTSERAARRFQVEGGMLRDRSEVALERTRAPAQPEAVAAAAELPAPEPADPLIDQVLTAWRERDEESGAWPEAAPAADPAPAPTPSAPPEASDREGELASLDGVDADLIAALAGAGVRTLEDLQGADALALASKGSLGFTRLLHLQFLARRGLAARPAADPGGDDVLVPRPPPSERRAAGAPTRPSPPAAAPAEAAPGTQPPAAPRFSSSDRPDLPTDSDFEAELERFAREARAALERDSTGAPLSDEGGSGPFA